MNKPVSKKKPVPSNHVETEFGDDLEYGEAYELLQALKAAEERITTLAALIERMPYMMRSKAYVAELDVAFSVCASGVAQELQRFSSDITYAAKQAMDKYGLNEVKKPKGFARPGDEGA